MKLIRWRVVCVLAVMISLMSIEACAQEADAARLDTWGIMAGGVGVTGDFRGSLSSGVVGGIEKLFPLPTRRLALRADIVYNYIAPYHQGCPKGGIDPGFGCVGVDTWSRLVAGSLSLTARLNGPATRWSPYAFGGVAAYLTGNSDEPLTHLRPNHLGFQGGVGFEVRPREKTFFVEMRYLGVPPGGVVPVVIGMRF
jgi:hypothetical protein